MFLDDKSPPRTEHPFLYREVGVVFQLLLVFKTLNYLKRQRGLNVFVVSFVALHWVLSDVSAPSRATSVRLIYESAMWDLHICGDLLPCINSGI